MPQTQRLAGRQASCGRDPQALARPRGTARPPGRWAASRALLAARGRGTLEGLAPKRPRHGLPQAGANQTANDLMYNQMPRCHVLFPGVTLRPDVYGEKGLDISYNVSDNRTWTGLTQALHHFLAGRVQNALQSPFFPHLRNPPGVGGRGGPQLGQGRRRACPPGYSPAAQEANINCTSESYFFQESFLAPNHTKFSCKFTADMLQNCSGRPDPTFGFEEGKPCFIIKMNRVGEGVGGEEGTGPPPLLHACWPRACLPSDTTGSRHPDPPPT